MDFLFVVAPQYTVLFGCDGLELTYVLYGAPKNCFMQRPWIWDYWPSHGPAWPMESGFRLY